MKIYILIILVLIFSCSLEDKNTIVFGILSDVHGNAEKTKYFLDIFQENNVQYVVIPGDIAEHFRKTPEMLNDEEQIYQVLKAVSDYNFTVLAIPGNHDSKEAYYGALNRLNNSNIIDGTRTNYFGVNDMNLIFIPGYFIPSMIVENGFIFDEKDIEIKKLAATKNTILVAHSPPKFTTKDAIDVVYGGKNVGSDLLTELIKEKNISFGIFGHIHEAGGKGVNLKEEIIMEDSWSNELFLNPSSVIPWNLINGTPHNGTAAIMLFKQGKAKYKIIY